MCACCVVVGTSGCEHSFAIACRRRLLTPRRVRRSCPCTATGTATCGAVTSTAASASGAKPAARCAAPSSEPARATSGVALRIYRASVQELWCTLQVQTCCRAAGTTQHNTQGACVGRQRAHLRRRHQRQRESTAVAIHGRAQQLLRRARGDAAAAGEAAQPITDAST